MTPFGGNSNFESLVKLSNIYSLNVDEHIEDAKSVNATSQESQMPVRTESKEARKVSPTQDQIEASSKTKSKVINSDNTKQPNQIGRPVKVAIVGDSTISNSLIIHEQISE